MSDVREVVRVPPGIAALSGIFCGCGDGDAAWAEVLRHLEAADAGKGAREMGEPWSGPDYIVSYLLNRFDLLGHGCSVHFCWLNAPGKDAIAFLRKWGANWQAAGPEFVDDDDVHHESFD